MKHFFLITMCTALLWSCSSKNEIGKITITGEIKDAPNQNIYLEQLFFSEKNPEILDTTEIKKGNFTLSALAPEQGLYRLRLQKSEAPFIFINDKPAISIKADYTNLSIENIVFNSPANQLLRNFLTEINSQRKELENKSLQLQRYPNPVEKDSAFSVMKKDFAIKEDVYKNYIIQYLDTTTNPIMAMFSIGYTRSIEPEKLAKTIGGLGKRFPGNQDIASVVMQYNQMIAQNKTGPVLDKPAPDINMPDTSGKAFALSMLRGKYVLVDFWASWCGPCRGENPNLVKAFGKYKTKNFTVLGVSLDKDKASWIKAINDDHLTWYHISDLKFWSSAAVSLYGFDGIPYNVLVSPEGNIIASNLRGQELEIKLAELIK